MVDRAVGPDQHIDRCRATIGSASDDHIGGAETGELTSDHIDVTDARQRAPGEQRGLTEVRCDRHRRRKEPLAIRPLDLLADETVAATIDEYTPASMRSATTSTIAADPSRPVLTPAIGKVSAIASI